MADQTEQEPMATALKATITRETYEQGGAARVIRAVEAYVAAHLRERDAQIAHLSAQVEQQKDIYRLNVESMAKLTDTLRAERDAAQQQRDVFKAAFDELHATVQGECSSLLDPDRGGSDVLWKLCGIALSTRDSQELIADWQSREARAALQSTRPQEQP